ncbi:MAG: hypothetical protein CVU05_00680 [Bacteroidetes bacterium HGW-Bacteroidetes-21]|jgi:hypothetical protein|nr:MAG: hypothetical protein CVU05_00680 [Bacteroidetes bacterium HGW-Bacteroidetes-21]
MNKFILLLLLITLFTFTGKSQPVNGEVLQNSNPYVIKVWGNHYERGYATGYLLAQPIYDIYTGYILPLFGSNLALAKTMLQEGSTLQIEANMISEAQGVIDGMTAAGITATGFDYLDLLLGNTFLDVQNINTFLNMPGSSPGCSSLISWGDATSGTSIDGKSMITRNLDWSTNAPIINNQAIVIHLPSESDEQPWLMIGFAGQIGVLSGVNQSGLGLFQHSMSDSYSTGSLGLHYQPIWFCLRNALEKADYNGDGFCNTLDMRSSVLSSINGYADGFIISAIAKNTFGNDSLTAMIAELAPAQPTMIFRDNTFPDSIPGDNLYAANYEIKRLNHMHFCSRYDAVKNALNSTSGNGIDKADSWEIMADSSSAGFNNVQMMQYIPEDDALWVSFHSGDSPASENTPVFYNLAELFMPTNVSSSSIIPSSFFYPNPGNATLHFNCTDFELQKVRFISSDGICCFTIEGSSIYKEINTECWNSGLYIVEITKKDGSTLISKWIKLP